MVEGRFCFNIAANVHTNAITFNTMTQTPKFKVLSITLYDVEVEDGHKQTTYLTTVNKVKLVEDIEAYRRLLALK